MYDDVTLMKVPVFKASNVIECVVINVLVVVVHVNKKTYTVQNPLKSVRIHQRVHKCVSERYITHCQVNSIVHCETLGTTQT